MDKIEQTKPTGEIKAIFSIKEDSNIAGIEFFNENGKTDWDNLTRVEQIKLLNSWISFYELFLRNLKDE